MPRPRKGGDICAIFVHAGAGFHSQSNERAHLETCENAAKVAMTMLKNGGSAVDAVEMAIMLLEDSEITNAGYGSNLTIDGGVECDATVVDHKGRSGAAGAVAHVKNPISLARVILEASTRPLSLQRVPPNFLVGPGATDFAYEQGLVILPHDGLVSEGARERWNRWQHDLQMAELNEKQQHPARYQNDRIKAYFRSATPSPVQTLASPSSVGDSLRADQRSDDSYDSSQSQEDQAVTSPANLNSTPPESRIGHGVKYMDGPSPVASSNSTAPRFYSRVSTRGIQSASVIHSPMADSSAVGVDTSNSEEVGDKEGSSKAAPVASGINMGTDQISDTVGAIAVDCHGNIAAGSSSGGIGMKHRGRIGPAALVGIGTAVIPVDPNDHDRTSVACVTSGTGEHIATTLAASTCASRVYYSERKSASGAFEEVTEEEAMKAMIDGDFMGHPGVRTSHCQGAIGIMTVKKTAYGVHLYFGHNTDSFALASMSSEDKKPTSVMSRSSGNGSIAQGGRACRVR
ncbi:asparaginase, partial [Aspergillus sclerotialis]